jgi:hypothetical protein
MYAKPQVIMSAMRLFTGESDVPKATGCRQASERGKIPRTNQT